MKPKPRPTPPSYADCRLSNLVLEGGRKKCYRPKEHQGDCGEPLSDHEEERRILYGRCGAVDWIRGVLRMKGRR